MAISPFVSTFENMYAYDCSFGFMIGNCTSINIGGIWAHHCDVGYAWGAVIDRSTYTPSSGLLMYVTAIDIAADGCNTPHKFFGMIRGLQISGLGIEGVNGTKALDFSQYTSTEDMTKIIFENISCWVQSSMNTGVTRFIELPPNEDRIPQRSIILESGYLRSDYAISLMGNSANPNNGSQCQSIDFGDAFSFIKVTDTSVTGSILTRSITHQGRVYGEAPLLGKNSYNGTLLSSANVSPTAYFRQALTEEATFILPWSRAVDILLTTQGEESRFEGGCFLAGEMSIIPVNKNGLGGSESGGRLMFSISGSDEASVSSGVLWSNKDAGDKNLTGINVTKRVSGGQTFIRVDTASASMTMAIVHMKLTYCGFAHYYDRRWSIKTL